MDPIAPMPSLFEALVGPLVGGQLYELSLLPRPGNTFRVTATQPADAARLSCLAGLMAHGVVGSLLRANSVTKGVTKALRWLS